mgnify:CR=1 FL=1
MLKNVPNSNVSRNNTFQNHYLKQNAKVFKELERDSYKNYINDEDLILLNNDYANQLQKEYDYFRQAKEAIESYKDDFEDFQNDKRRQEESSDENTESEAALTYDQVRDIIINFAHNEGFSKAQNQNYGFCCNY